MKTEKLHVKGMSCGHCVKSVEKALEALGVRGEVDLQSKKAEVQYDETSIELAAIKDAIEEQGYTVV